MPRLFGPRTAVEAAFIVAVPITVGFGFGASRWTIVAAAGVAYLLIVLVEAFIWYEGKRAPARRPRSLFGRRAKQNEEAPVAAEPAEEVVVVRPHVEPQSEVVPEPEPAPAPPVHAPTDHVRVFRRGPEPEREPESEPEPVIAAAPDPEPERAPLVAVPAPEPEPVPVGAPTQPAASSTVVPIGVGSSPRQWNLWDLERLTRENSGGDSARNEERTFLLMYLREFADADGMLPIDFDGLVRDSFGDLVGSR